ncbi:hypothetical protein HUG10_15835 [Halorarum halophilum]|uniref:MalT-like winged helix domain-containing protein n=1 Tax=Halorarum halophilum TaxID=2743090 RepID=A0A7D5L2Y0_9EURY|nr:hypothetical protein [Halobaculum halophilum]QLG28923.1 hypothetical protein HUG10_15835 [Halobaculum halophilum]
MEQDSLSNHDSLALANVERPEVDRIASSVRDGNTLTHVFGEVGTMSNDLLERTKTTLEEWSIRSFHVSELYDTDYVIQQLALELYDTLPRRTRLLIQAKSASLSTPVGGGGLGTENPFNRPIDLLRRVSDRVSTETVVFIHDIHTLSAPPAEITAALQEIKRNLSDSVSMVTSGEYRLNGVHSIEARPLPEDTFTDVVTTQWPKVNLDRAEEIYDGVEGMPLYLGLLLEANGSDDDVAISNVADEATAILEDYVASLSIKEQEFLRTTSVLLELDERVCAHLTGLSRPEAAELLRGLADQLAIRKVGRRDGIARYKLRSDLQGYLYTHAEAAEESHRTMLEYYLEELFKGESQSLLGRALYPGLLCSHHLKGSVGGNLTAGTIKAELDTHNLDLEEKLELCLTFLPHFCILETDTEEVLFELLDEVREEIADRYPSEFEFKQIIGVDGYRIGFRLLVARNTPDDEQATQLYQQMATLADETLEYIATHSDEADGLETWVQMICLASAYAYQKCGEQELVETRLEPVFQKLEALGIPRTMVIAVYHRTMRFADQLEFDTILDELLSSELDDTFTAIGERQSAKEYLSEARGKMGNAFNGTGASLYEELQNYPAAFTRYIDDITSIIDPTDLHVELEEFPVDIQQHGYLLCSLVISVLYQLTSMTDLYQLCYSEHGLRISFPRKEEEAE